MNSLSNCCKILKKLPICKVAFLQALGLVIYCGLVGTIFWKGNTWFGKMDNYLGPVLMLTLMVVSVLICALIAFGYPIILFWDEKKTKKAIKLVIYTALWLVVFILLVMLVLRFF